MDLALQKFNLGSYVVAALSDRAKAVVNEEFHMKRYTGIPGITDHPVFISALVNFLTISSETMDGI
jgi:hypothetical protein